MTSPTSPSPAHICTRFAPSPSGHLHVGGARTALFCWVYAKARGGKFILRIEDTDQKRSSEAASLGFLEDLKWLGITWDEGPESDGPDGKKLGGGPNGPYFQSQRLDIYNDCIERLIASGHAYRAFENPEELNAARQKAQAEKRNYRYDRAALKLSPEMIKQYMEEGRPHVVRFRVPDSGEVVVHDQVRGEVVTHFTELDDFVIRKADGYPMYNFAVVVDDEMMQVTHIIRAQEHLSNTPRHILLQQALGFRMPVYAHVSIITNPDGSKMSKRDKDKSLRAEVKKRTLASSPVDPMSGHPIIVPDRWNWWQSNKDHQLDLNEAEALAKVLNITLPEINVDDFRRNGYLPEVMINYLALLGWNPGENVEKFDLAFLKERFDFDRVIKSPAAFDRNKLLAFNADAILAMPPETFEQRLREHCERYHPGMVEKLGDRFGLFARTNQSRSKTLEHQIGPSRFFIMPDDAIVYDKGKAIDDALIKTVAESDGASAGAAAGAGAGANGLHHLEAIIPVLEGVSPWEPRAIESAVKQYAEARAQNKMGLVAQPLRIAVTGGTVSPAIFDTLAILGRTSTLHRIWRCIDLHSVNTR